MEFRGWHCAREVWFGSDGATLRVLTPGGRELVLEGALAAAVAEQNWASSVLRAAASWEPALAELLDAVRTAPVEPLDRARLLRGPGYGVLFLELTARCNERCTHCYAESAPERTETLPWSVVEAVLEDAARLSFERVQLTGGDPLLAPTLLAAVSGARALRIPEIEIFTNGLALTAGLLDELAPFRPSFAFSLYSASPEEHDANTRVVGSHAKTLRALRACRERGLGVRVGVTLLRQTLGGEGALLALLEQQGVSRESVTVTHSHAVGRGEYVGGRDAPGAHGGPLVQGAGKACVTADGSVVPCIFARQTVLGSIYSERLYDILSRRVAVQVPTDLARATAGAATRLSCSECRVREVLLRSPSPLPALTQLRSRSQ